MWACLQWTYCFGCLHFEGSENASGYSSPCSATPTPPPPYRVLRDIASGIVLSVCLSEATPLLPTKTKNLLRCRPFARLSSVGQRRLDLDYFLKASRHWVKVESSPRYLNVAPDPGWKGIKLLNTYLAKRYLWNRNTFIVIWKGDN
jgi:hypothetical protein